MDSDDPMRYGIILIVGVLVVSLAFMFEDASLGSFYSMDGIPGSALLAILLGADILAYALFAPRLSRW